MQKYYLLKNMFILCSYSIGKWPFLHPFVEIAKTRWWMGLGSLCFTSEGKFGILANSGDCLHKPSFEVSIILIWIFSIHKLQMKSYFLCVSFLPSSGCVLHAHVELKIVISNTARNKILRSSAYYYLSRHSNRLIYLK